MSPPFRWRLQDTCSALYVGRGINGRQSCHRPLHFSAFAIERDTGMVSTYVFTYAVLSPLLCLKANHGVEEVRKTCRKGNDVRDVLSLDCSVLFETLTPLLYPAHLVHFFKPDSSFKCLNFVIAAAAAAVMISLLFL